MLGQLGAGVILTATTERVHDRVAALVEQGIEASGIVCTLDTERGATALIKAL